MMIKHEYFFDSQRTLAIDEPTECPQCKCRIKPQLLAEASYQNEERTWFYVSTFLCKSCYKPFIAFYSVWPQDSSSDFASTTRLYVEPVRFAQKEYSEKITSLSPSFVKIYNQAFSAELSNLDEIAGIGYRKALEFLLKDFLISENPEKEETIKNAPLSQCIKNYIDDPNLKVAASRAVWLGNDQSHYIQKFVDKDIEDLKRLIMLSTHWIEMILLTRETEAIEPIK